MVKTRLGPGQRLPLVQAVSYDSIDAIRRVTVRQLSQATQLHTSALFAIDGRELKTFVIVANVYFLESRPRWMDLGLDDGTGRIKARRWEPDCVDLEADTSGFRDYTYIHLIGELEQYMGINSVKVIHIRRVETPYEVYYHTLHVILDTLSYEYGPPPPYAWPVAARAESTDMRPYDISVDGTDHGFPPSQPHNLVALPSRVILSPITIPADPASAGSVRPPGPPEATPTKPSNGGKIRSDSHPELEQILPTFTNSLPQSRRAGPSREIVDESCTNTQKMRSGRLVHRPADDNPTAWAENPHMHAATLTGPTREPKGSFPPPSRHATPPPRRPLRPDPYAKLTLLQRDIILCIQKAEPSYGAARASIYPSIGQKSQPEIWRGISMFDIVRAAKFRHPNLTEAELGSSMDFLVNEGYICNPVDIEHYSNVIGRVVRGQAK